MLYLQHATLNVICLFYCLTLKISVIFPKNILTLWARQEIELVDYLIIPEQQLNVSFDRQIVLMLTCDDNVLNLIIQVIH